MLNLCRLAALNQGIKVIFKVDKLDTVEVTMGIYMHENLHWLAAVSAVLHGVRDAIGFHGAGEMGFDFAAGLAFVLR